MGDHIVTFLHEYCIECFRLRGKGPLGNELLILDVKSGASTFSCFPPSMNDRRKILMCFEICCVPQGQS